MFGSKLRCPTCNQYVPDRCACQNLGRQNLSHHNYVGAGLRLAEAIAAEMIAERIKEELGHKLVEAERETRERNR